MEPNQFISKARCAARCGASGKHRNVGDGLIWPTEGRFFEPPEQRLSPLVVSRTMARRGPCQQTRKTGQMFPTKRNMLPQ